MEEVNELVEVADAVRHQFASADDAAKLAAAAAVTSDLEALCASRESDARSVIEREFLRSAEKKKRERGGIPLFSIVRQERRCAQPCSLDLREKTTTPTQKPLLFSRPLPPHKKTHRPHPRRRRRDRRGRPAT